MKLGVAVLAVAMVVLGAAGSAQAALTSSEQAQIRDFVAGARAENAARVRSLVARTDLTVEESLAVLSESVAAVPFTEARAVFLRELAFGVSSASSRPLLAHALTRALLARADAVYQKYVGGLDHEPRAITELIAIYAFLDSAVANAGRPTATAHDASAGISAAAYDDCSKELRRHVERNARWLKGDVAVPESVGPVRAQAQVALLDMLPDGLTRRVDAADRLALRGARRQMLADWGILVADAGKLDETKAERLRQTLGRLPGARVDLALVYVGEDRAPLRARGAVAFVFGAGAESRPFGDELTPLTVDGTTSAIAADLGLLSVKHALETRADLRAQAERDAAAAQGDPGRLLGTPRAPSVEHVVGSAAHLLLLDASRAVDLAFVRAAAGRFESAALLSDAIGAIGTGIPGLSAIRLAPSGVALGFTLDGHAWSIERSGPAFAVTGVKRDGQPLALGHLATARPPRRSR